MKKSKPGSAQTRPLAPAAARPGVKGLGGGQDRLPQQRLRVPSAGRLVLLGLWERTGHSPATSWPNPPRLFSSPPPPPHPPTPRPATPAAGCPPPQPLGWDNSELPQMDGSSRREGPRPDAEKLAPSPFRGRCLLFSGFDFSFLKGQGPLQPVGVKHSREEKGFQSPREPRRPDSESV